MKYFIDCEFLEFTKQPKLFGLPIDNKVNTTELISIALVPEDSKKSYFYGEANWFNKKAANKHVFLKEHVLPNLMGEGCKMNREQIKQGILDVIKDDPNPQLIGFWSAYDWWVFCMELFGNMQEAMQATKFWYYTDIKTLAHDCLGWSKRDILRVSPLIGKAHNALGDALWLKDTYFIVKEHIQNKLTKELTTVSHYSMASLIKYTFGRCTENEDGSYTIPKNVADKWLSRSEKDFNSLTDKELGTPNEEAAKYMKVFEKYCQFFLT